MPQKNLNTTPLKKPREVSRSPLKAAAVPKKTEVPKKAEVPKKTEAPKKTENIVRPLRNPVPKQQEKEVVKALVKKEPVGNVAGISTPAPRVFNKSRSPPPNHPPFVVTPPESPSNLDKQRLLESKKVDRRGKPDMPWLKNKKKVSTQTAIQANQDTKGDATKQAVASTHAAKPRAKTRDGRESGRDSKLSSEVAPEQIPEINSSIDLRNLKKKQAPPRRPTFKRFKTQTRDRNCQVLNTNKTKE